MSGPRPRMGGHRLVMLRISDPGSLCPDCDISPGWGHELTEEEKAWRGDPNALPPAGNGYDIQGPCRTCGGSGLCREPNYALMARGRCEGQEHHMDTDLCEDPCNDCINYVVEMEKAVMAQDCSVALSKTIDEFLVEQRKLFR